MPIGKLVGKLGGAAVKSAAKKVITEVIKKVIDDVIVEMAKSATQCAMTPDLLEQTSRVRGLREQAQLVQDKADRCIGNPNEGLACAEVIQAVLVSSIEPYQVSAEEKLAIMGATLDAIESEVQIMWDEVVNQTGKTGVWAGAVQAANWANIAVGVSEAWYFGVSDARWEEAQSKIVARVAAKADNIQKSNLQIAGTWDSDFGRMTLRVAGSQLAGTYTHQQGQLEGFIVGKLVCGTWTQHAAQAGAQNSGEFQFQLAADGKTFRGFWRYGTNGAGWNGQWNGKKVVR